MKRALLALAVLVAAMLPLAAIAAADGNGGPDDHGGVRGKAVTYAVIGDTPYGTPQLENFPNDVAEINADPQVSLAMHLGDIKNGSSQCTTSYFEQIRADFDGFTDPLVYTPGDNEWTDCHRANNGAFWPAGPVLNGDTRPARLDEIRRIFFPAPGWTLGQNARRVGTQGGEYPENVTWTQADVQFGDDRCAGLQQRLAAVVRTAPDQLASGRGRTTGPRPTSNGSTGSSTAPRRACQGGRDRDPGRHVGPGDRGRPSQYDHFQPIV